MCLSALGLGFVFTSTLVMIGQQFDKWRGLVFGFCTCGISTANIVQPLLTSWMCDVFGWRGALAITGATILNVCPVAMLMHICSRKLRKLQIELKIETTFYDKNTCNSIEKQFGATSKLTKPLWTLEYIMLHLNGLLFSFGQSVVYTHIVALFVSLDYSYKHSLHLVSVMGVSNVVGRIILGLLARRNFCISLSTLFSVSYVTAGISCFFLAFTSTFLFSIFLSIVLGFTLAAYGPVYNEYLCSIVDPNSGNRFAHAYGMLLVSMGVGTLFGAPSAGLLFDWTRSYRTSFIVGAASFTLSGLVVCIPRLSKRCINYEDSLS